MAKTPADKGMNPAKLQGLVEPLTVRIERIMGGMSSKIELPPTADGSTEGTGWTRDDVLRIERWLESQPQAQGAYIAKLVDAGQNLYEYTFVIRGSTAAPVFSSPMAPLQGQQPQQQNASGAPGVFWGGNGNGGWPGQGWGGQMTQIPNGNQDQLPPWMMSMMRQGQNPFGPPQGQGQNDTRVEQLQRQLEADRLARLQADAQHERERADARHAAEMAAMNQRLEALTAAMTQAQAARPTEDPRLAALEQQNRDLVAAQQRAEDQRRHEQQLAAIQAASNQQFQALQAQIAANAQPRQDPMLPVITLVQATMSQQASIMQEASRNQLAANDKNLQFMRESQAANSGIMNQVGQAFNMVVDGARKAMDMANEARGGGGGTTEMVVEGLKFLGSEGADIAKKWTAGADKREAVKAQKEVTLKQLELQAALASKGITGPQQQQAPAPAQANLAGAEAPSNNGPVADAPATVTKLTAVPSALDAADEKWFKYAIVIKSVRELRASVAARKFTAPQVAQAIVIAVGQVAKNNLEVPAFELLKKAEIDELFELLLPSTAPSFRDECAACLAAILTGKAPVVAPPAKASEPEDDDEDGDEDDDEDDDDDEEAEQAPA